MAEQTSTLNTDVLEHPFAEFVRTIGRGKRARRDFTREEAAASFHLILSNHATDAQIGAWLMLLRVKEETSEELAGFVDACRAWLSKQELTLPHADIDWPSYAGKKKHHPWYILAALLLAENGHRIFMHGGAAHTPQRLYADDVLSQLGIPLAASLDDAHKQLDSSNFTYVGLNVLCPKLDELLMMRFQLGLRSPVNTLTRCMNPAKAPTSLQSVFHPSYIVLQQGAAQLLNEPQLAIFKGEGGEVEIRPDAETRIFGLNNGAPFETVWPARMARQTPPGVAQTSELISIWREEQRNEYGEAAVIDTAAVVLFATGKMASQEQAREKAFNYWQARDKTRF